MRIILTGATGFVGGEVLEQALQDPAITTITSLSRRKLDSANPKLASVVLPDFLDYSGMGAALEAEACLWCLGVSQTAVKRDEYIRITHDYALAGARAMLAANPGLRFCFVSGSGADQQEKARTLFGKIKGRTERELSALSPAAVHFRPALIRPSRSTQRRPLVARLFLPVADVVDRFTDGFSVEVGQLARCLIDVAKHGTGKLRAGQRILDNAAIRNWA